MNNTHFFPEEVFQFPHGRFLVGGRDSWREKGKNKIAFKRSRII